MAGSHEAIGWLRPESDLTLSDAAARLAEQLPNAEVSDVKVSQRSQSLCVSFRGWKLWLHLVEAGHVAEEAREFAGWYPQDSRAAQIADCIRRVEVYCPGEDARGRHRKDFLAVCAVLAQFRGVVLRDPVEGAWL
ncbi:MAG TPA: hypothetical protein VH682_26825 [Gemmataceae bacterium]|jgi:hypothetical protein